MICFEAWLHDWESLWRSEMLNMGLYVTLTQALMRSRKQYFFRFSQCYQRIRATTRLSRLRETSRTMVIIEAVVPEF